MVRARGPLRDARSAVRLPYHHGPGRPVRRYADTAVPTTLIWGDRDALTPLDQGRNLHGLIKGSALLVMPEVGHIPELEDPGAFNSLLTAAARDMARR